VRVGGDPSSLRSTDAPTALAIIDSQQKGLIGDFCGADKDRPVSGRGGSPYNL
jgi:hypothetical protein